MYIVDFFVFFNADYAMLQDQCSIAGVTFWQQSGMYIVHVSVSEILSMQRYKTSAVGKCKHFIYLSLLIAISIAVIIQMYLGVYGVVCPLLSFYYLVIGLLL